VSKRLERENARDLVDEFCEYHTPSMIAMISRNIRTFQFEAAAAYCRDLANRCDEMKEHAAKLNGGDNG